MWIAFLLAAGVVFGLLKGVALRPVATLVAIVRVLLFLLATTMLVATFFFEELSSDSRTEMIPIIAGAYAAWALTFLIPAVLRGVMAARQKE